MSNNMWAHEFFHAAGADTFLIVFGTNAVGGYDDLDKRFDAWTVPALVPLKGTWVGDLSADPVMTGGTVPASPNPLKLQDAADALLYLAHATLSRPCTWRERSWKARRMAGKWHAASKSFSATL
jgi:hypothetical protein